MVDGYTGRIYCEDSLDIAVKLCLYRRYGSKQCRNQVVENFKTQQNENIQFRINDVENSGGRTHIVSFNDVVNRYHDSKTIF